MTKDDEIRAALIRAEALVRIEQPRWHWGVVTDALRAESRRHVAIAKRAKNVATRDSNIATSETLRDIAISIERQKKGAV